MSGEFTEVHQSLRFRGEKEPKQREGTMDRKANGYVHQSAQRLWALPPKKRKKENSKSMLA
jgi:hypothetical protein